MIIKLCPETLRDRIRIFEKRKEEWRELFSWLSERKFEGESAIHSRMRTLQGFQAVLSLFSFLNQSIIHDIKSARALGSQTSVLVFYGLALVLIPTSPGVTWKDDIRHIPLPILYYVGPNDILSKPCFTYSFKETWDWHEQNWNYPMWSI